MLLNINEMLDLAGLNEDQSKYVDSGNKEIKPGDKIKFRYPGRSAWQTSEVTGKSILYVQTDTNKKAPLKTVLNNSAEVRVI